MSSKIVNQSKKDNEKYALLCNWLTRLAKYVQNLPFLTCTMIEFGMNNNYRGAANTTTTH